MDEEEILESFDTPKEKAIWAGYRQSHPGSDGEIDFGIIMNGLDSQLVFIPNGESWADHADMYIRSIHNPANEVIYLRSVKIRK